MLWTSSQQTVIDQFIQEIKTIGWFKQAGEQISLTDLAAAVKAEEKAPKAKKSRAAKPKKPSIRAHILLYYCLE